MKEKNKDLEISNKPDLVDTLKRLEKRLSLSQTFFRGFVQGTGQLLGATIGIAIIFFVMGRILQGMDKLPLLSDLVNRSVIIQVVKDEINHRDN